MLITPLSGRMSLRNLPVATLAIILINCVVFFFFQSSDPKIYQDAKDYYLDSGLAALEVAAYEQYREFGSVVDPDAVGQDVPSTARLRDEIFSLMVAIQDDDEFMTRLQDDRIITPEMNIYASWREKRSSLEGLLGSTTVMRYGFRPADWSVKGVFGHIFLHGGFMHLLGNMVFLWLVGCILELAWGRMFFLCLYIAGGLFAAALFGTVYHASKIPLIGASGAIAALMGAYAVLYGNRRIKVFYWLGFSFNYTLVPGLVILALWIGNEAFQLLLGPESRIAYLAHIGGLGSGVLMGLVRRKIRGEDHEEVLEQGKDPGEKAVSLLDEALQRVEKLDTQRARVLLQQVLQIDPNNRTALTQMYHLDKIDPGSHEFHDRARRLLVHLADDRQAHRETLAVYQDYIQKAHGPRLPSSLLFSVSSYFAATGHLGEAERIMGYLLTRKPDLAKMPEGLLHIARACMKGGSKGKAKSYLQVICMRYPLSRECLVARRLLDDLDD
ncbi:MAG: rhomboid family intramembrane serine protease [Desulfomonilia bacterium]|nr:rhomboid family intramembrane serine protease [Desulfomonilia bacterium]